VDTSVVQVLIFEKNMVLSIKYFVTLVTLSSKAWNFFKMFQNLHVQFNLFFPIHGGCWVIGFKFLKFLKWMQFWVWFESRLMISIEHLYQGNQSIKQVDS